MKPIAKEEEPKSIISRLPYGNDVAKYYSELVQNQNLFPDTLSRLREQFANTSLGGGCCTIDYPNLQQDKS